MGETFKNAIKNRRSYYGLSNKSSISDQEIKEIINWAVLNVPSAFNSQSTRIVLLLGENHKKLWEITKSVLQQKISAKAFVSTEEKINNCFLSGYGTVLFYEDISVVETLQKNFPSYTSHFAHWSMHTSGMHQFSIWTMLRDAGLGASLQHYNPVIDQEVARTWNINNKWELIAQMPFGVPTAEPQAKEFQPLEDRILFFD